jgi:Pro-kumamolisin, activation domain
MRLPKSSLYRGAFLFVSILIFPFGRAAAQTTNILSPVTQVADERNLVVLKGNVHPLARLEFDQGAAPLDLRMDRMLLVLKRSPEQESALLKLLDDQQDRSSPRYRHWLTPEQFGQQFGPSDTDVRKVTGWLLGHGFQNVQVSKGRTVIEFSGAASQVQETFGTSIHKFVVNGEEHWANASDPAIPGALSPVVEGVLTLHNFFKQPQVHVTESQITVSVAQGSLPQFTSSTGMHALTPFDYYKIYNFNPTQPYGPVSDRIAIVGRSNINLQDVGYFDFWLLGNQAGSAQVIVNGPDPGDLGGAEETEAVLDTTWAGAITHGGVLLVVSKSTASTDGVDLSELYIIDNNLAGIMSESFADCESNFTSTQAAGIANLAAQAATQGITYVVAAGGCRARVRTEVPRYSEPPKGRAGPRQRAYHQVCCCRRVASNFAVAPVTLDAWDWAFSRVYEDAKKRADTALQKEVVSAYLSYSAAVFDYEEKLSGDLIGYEPKQILLLHANPLEADHIGELLEMLRKRGYRFITLEEALSDQAYDMPDTYIGEEGTGWLEHWAITRGRPPLGAPVFPPAIAQRSKALPPTSGETPPADPPTPENVMASARVCRTGQDKSQPATTMFGCKY